MWTRFFERALVLTILLCIFIPISLNRLIAGDEGFYVLAAKLVASGDRLYSDFFYPQMPLLPWIYGTWMRMFGPTWESVRILAGIFSALIGYLIYLHLLAFNRRWAIFGIFLFVTSTLVFAWYGTVKTFSISILFLFSSYYLLDKKSSLNSWIKLVLAGILFGLSVETRLFFAGLYPIFLLLIFIRPDPMTGFLKSALLFSLGCTIALFPSIYLAISNFDIFYFNNLGYHLIRSDRGDDAMMRAKLTILNTVLGLRDSHQITGYQLPTLLVLSGFYAFGSIFSKTKIDSAFIVALGLFILNFIPSPSYVQYFSTLMPFLIIGAVSSLYSLYKFYLQNTYRPKKSLAFISILLFSAIFITGSYEDLQKYMKNGIGVIGIGPGDAPNKTISAVSEIGEKISQSINPNEEVLAEWPGFLINSTAKPVPGLENNFGWKVGHKISPELRRKYKIISRDEIKKLIQNGVPSSVILEVKSYKRNYKNSMNLYDIAWKDHGVIFFRKKA